MACVVFEGYFIQYKFIIPNELKHSSYTYQKLFRALYGYTQSVSKSSGKNYKYHRKGVLSEIPYIRAGKNSILIPQKHLAKLIEFFKTGKNPTHAWETKGDWKAVYYMDEKKIDENLVVESLEELLERTYVQNNSKQHVKIADELNEISLKLGSNQEIKQSYLNFFKEELKKILSNQWFKECYSKSIKLKEFYDKTQNLG